MVLNSIFEEELEVLQSIYIDELKILEISQELVELEIIIHPNTAELENERYVCLTLHFHVNEEYPEKETVISICNPRGLSEAHLESIEVNLKQLANNNVGEAMLYTLIEYAKDSLSDNNHPSCDCPICLEKFEIDDQFLRLDCYHYLHKGCVNRYLKVAEELFCPICRLPFKTEGFPPDSVTMSKDPAGPVTFNEEYKGWQLQCKMLFEHQKSKGGIIDIEEEKNKYLVTMTTNENVPSCLPRLPTRTLHSWQSLQVRTTCNDKNTLNPM